MSEYVLSCCSTTDLTKEHLDRRDLSYICFHYNMDGVEHDDDVWQSITADEFYKRLVYELTIHNDYHLDESQTLIFHLHQPAELILV